MTRFQKYQKILSHKSHGSLVILIIVVVLGIISLFMILLGTGLTGTLTGNNSGVDSSSGTLSCTTSVIPTAQKSIIERNMNTYQQAADKAGIPWEFLVALHYRESNLSNTPSSNPADGPFQVQGAKYKTFGVDSATEAAEKAKGLVKGTYGKTLTKNADEETIKLAFLAYNRGSMYKTGGCTWDQSPYVMNQFDADHEDMRWPNNSCEPKSTQGKINKPLGAFTIYSALKGCSNATGNSRFLGKTALPIKTITGYNTTLHGRSISRPEIVSNHDVVLGPYPNNYGIPVKRQPGEAVDLMAPTKTPVFAPFDGKIVYKGTLGSNGDFIIIQSTDGQSFAVLAHIQNYPARGSLVSAGQQVGELFPLGRKPHLHFELWINKKPINAGTSTTPLKIWQAQKAALGL